MFASAVVWQGYHYKKYTGEKIRWAVSRKVKNFIAAADLPMHVVSSGNTGVTITADDGKALLCADLRYCPKNVLKSRCNKERKSPAELLDAEIDKIRSTIGNLAETILPDNPGAPGVAVFVDEIGLLKGSSACCSGRMDNLAGGR